MVEAAEADVVRPAVAANDPHALLNEIVGERIEPACQRIVQPSQRRTQRVHPLALRGNSRFAVLRGSEQLTDQPVTQAPTQAGEQRACLLRVLIDGQAEAEAELGVVFEERI